MFDPFYSADLFISEPPGRSLVGLVEEITKELENSWLASGVGWTRV